MRVVYVGSIKFSFDTVVGVVWRSYFELINERTHNNRQRNHFSKSFFLKTSKLILKKSNSRNTNFARGSVHSYEQSFSKSRAAALLCNRLYDHIWTLGKSTCWGFVEFVFFSVAVKKNVWRHGLFVHLVLLKLTVPGLWRLYFGVLSRQISCFWTFLEPFWLVDLMPVARLELTLNLELTFTVCVYEYRWILLLQSLQFWVCNNMTYYLSVNAF